MSKCQKYNGALPCHLEVSLWKWTLWIFACGSGVGGLCAACVLLPNGGRR